MAPMADDDLDDIRSLTLRKRAHHLAQVERLDAVLRLLDGQFSDSSPAAGRNATSSSDGEHPYRSVRVKVLDLLAEAPRDWSVNEIVAEYGRRGDPIPGLKPPSGVRSAIAKLYNDKAIIRTGQGRYISKQWSNTTPPAVQGPPPSTNGAEPSMHEEMAG